MCVSLFCVSVCNSECLQPTFLTQLCMSGKTSDETGLASLLYWPVQQLHQYSRVLVKVASCFDEVRSSSHSYFCFWNILFPLQSHTSLTKTQRGLQFEKTLKDVLQLSQVTSEFQSLHQGCSQYEALSLSLLRKKKEAESTFLFWKSHSGKTTVSKRKSPFKCNILSYCIISREKNRFEDNDLYYICFFSHSNMFQQKVAKVE